MRRSIFPLANTCWLKRTALPVGAVACLPALSEPVGVRHNKAALSDVRGIDGASRKYKRLHGVTFTFQISLYDVERQIGKVINVLDNHPTGLASSYNAEQLRPEVTVISRAALLPGIAERLARDSCDHKVNVSKFITLDFLDIM
ncbi:hypothetical protein KSF_015690 [Reticulibacter mediterranei]|uniref:Uncharacterized protein n=1 Tax=Reticulibacter mediterranei TaxID=2778369 RepID=A0A8J3IL50_9CHLR|nr:hypothetical protein KSF_015690 [Reticulibacter mediterranei]